MLWGPLSHTPLVLKIAILEIEVGVVHVDKKETRVWYNECLWQKPTQNNE